MAILRKLVFASILILLALLAGIFAYSNPDPIAVDIGFVRLDSVSMSAAFAGAFGLGWLFGLISAGLALLRLAGERRRLRRELQLAEAELSSLRSMPLHDAN